MEGADQPAPKRNATLTGMPTAPRLDAPPLPPELAPTRRAPSPWGQTVMRPTPPSAVAHARRTDPPPTSGPPSDESTLQSGLDALPSPPRDKGSEELRRRLEAAEARAAELERQARVRAETDSPASFPPQVSERRPPAPPPSAVPASVPPAGWSDPRVIKAVLALVGAMTALGTPLGIWLTAKATAAESAQKRQAEVAKDATQTASSAKAESRDVAKELDALKQQLAARDAYDRAILRKLGVEYPASKNEPAEPTLETQTPRRKPGSVTPQPVLVVVAPPPP